MMPDKLLCFATLPGSAQSWKNFWTLQKVSEALRVDLVKAAEESSFSPGHIAVTQMHLPFCG